MVSSTWVLSGVLCSHLHTGNSTGYTNLRTRRRIALDSDAPQATVYSDSREGQSAPGRSRQELIFFRAHGQWPEQACNEQECG